MKTEFFFKGISVVHFEHTKGETTSTHLSTEFNLEVSKNLDIGNYLDKEDVPTKEGAKALTHCFIQGLLGNIHTEHQNGNWDSAEHLRFIIAELEQGFVQVATIHKSNFTE